MPAHVKIIGAGPAGLAAALTVVNLGGQATVFEAHADVGARFHGDFQGLENWTTGGDVLTELANLGIPASFEHEAIHECHFFDAAGREYAVRAKLPLWYLVRRGPEPGSLDQALKQQALAAGVKILFNTPCHHLPGGGIIAHGPRRVDALATGYLFETDSADGAYAVVSDRLAPAGYGYLLIWGGRGTVAACHFRDFPNSRMYAIRTVDFFRERLGLRMTNPRPFAGYGNLHTGSVRNGLRLYVGEAAGLQDSLFGFGLRYALLSGHLAARAWLYGSPESYERLVREHFSRRQKLAIVNRVLYQCFGDRGYRWLVRTLHGASDPRAWLHSFYGSGWMRLLAYPLVRRRFQNQTERVISCGEGCDCTWCRCRHDLQKNLNHGPECQPLTGGIS